MFNGRHSICLFFLQKINKQSFLYTSRSAAQNTVMFYGKKVFHALLLFAATIICSFAIFPYSLALADTESLYLGGFPAGFVLNTTTVEVVGICDILTENGLCSPARESGIRTGDIIDKINGESVKKTTDITEIISRDYKKYEISIIRGGEVLTVDVTPVKELAKGGKRLGVLVKDTLNGIGTVTYIDVKNNKFASLGHPVTTVDGKLVGINGGTIYGSIIYDVKKGTRGTPGELCGAMESGNVIGKAELNCSCGVYGTISENFDCSNLIKVDKGSMDSVTIGPACIYTTVQGKDTEKYDISIVKVDKGNKDHRNFVIKVEDDRLIAKTGGIVQGMSGSPIIQNGKLIGAVTHVFVNDPTRGYGIGIENMLNAY